MHLLLIKEHLLNKNYLKNFTKRLETGESLWYNSIVNKYKKRGKSDMKKYVCQVCGYVYDEAAGDPDRGIAPGTKFEDLPDDWTCPLCGVGKDQFEEG